jgi:hypothetical protein
MIEIRKPITTLAVIFLNSASKRRCLSMGNRDGCDS